MTVIQNLLAFLHSQFDSLLLLSSFVEFNVLLNTVVLCLCF